MRLPQELVSAIEREIAGVDAKTLARAAEELSRSYSAGRPRGMLESRAGQAAYLVTRLPATFAAASVVMQEIAARLSFHIGSVLDLGAGAGTTSWAASAQLDSIREMTLIERNSALIEMGKRLATAASCEALRRARWISADLAHYELEREYDLAIASYSIGELNASAREQLLRRVWPRARALAIIEPGTPAGFKNVLAAREWLIASGAKMAAPCPAEHECPLAALGDWCHFAVRLERSALHRRLKAGGLGYEDEKFSYVVGVKEAAARAAAARIVRHPMHMKGHTRLELCTPAGLQQITIAKSQGEVYKRAKKARWGEEWR
jgi:ribosomal protein RSM22 (predicted rRNA methylase)